MTEFHDRLAERFSALRDSRQGTVFFVEHGLDPDEYQNLLVAVRTSLKAYPLDSGWWDIRHLTILTIAAEVGYQYRGSGTDFWPLLESVLEVELASQNRQRIRDFFLHACERFRGARPIETAWAQAFHLIAWPIAHALLPLEFHQPLALTLANLRANARESDDGTLYRAIRAAAPNPTARFLTFLEDAALVVSLTRSLLAGEGSEFSTEIVQRLSADLHADPRARRSMTVARNIQRDALLRPQVLTRLSVAQAVIGTLQLRRINKTFLLEAMFPQLEAEIVDPLRRSLRRRRFAPQFWGVSARVQSDQILSGLPFPLRLTTVPDIDATLLPGLEATELDARDIAVLQNFQLQIAPPHVFAVNTDEDVGRLVHDGVISAYRKYWALVLSDDIPKGVLAVGDIGPLVCLELDPSSPLGVRSLEQLGYSVRQGVSVRFAGDPSIDRSAELPTFVAGDTCLLLPERLIGDEVLSINVDGHYGVVHSNEVIQMTVGLGDNRVGVASETDSREYKFLGLRAPWPLPSPLNIDLRSEERTIQALLGGRFTFVVDGSAPIEGLRLTVDLDVGGRKFGATGPLGLVPQVVSTEHCVMKSLLGEDVRTYISAEGAVTLCARVGNLVQETWELERVVRSCWWQFHDGPKLLSESGPLKFGVVSVDEPVRLPIEGNLGQGIFLLAPVALDPLEFGDDAAFTTICLAPNRLQLNALSINKPKLERRRRANYPNAGLEDVADAYFRWTHAETQHLIADLIRRQVTNCLDAWMTEICCGFDWARAETLLPGLDPWKLLVQVCGDFNLGHDDYLTLSTSVEAQVRNLAVEEIRRSIPALWARVRPPSDLGDEDYGTLDRAFLAAYEQLAARYQNRGLNDIANELQEADPGESADKWNEALSIVRRQVELRPLAEMLLPSNGAGRLVALDVGEMTVDDVADELMTWALSSRKAFAGTLPSRDILKTSYALWIEPTLALASDWRSALDTLLAERTVARATRYLAVKARKARWSST